MDHRVPLVVDLPGKERMVVGEAIVNDEGYVIAEIQTEEGRNIFKTDLEHVSIGFQGHIPVEAIPVQNIFACACYERAGIVYKHKCTIHGSVINK